MAIPGPQNLTAIPLSSSIIHLIWENIDLYDVIEIRRDGTETKTVAGTAQEYIWGSLSPNTEYSFEIRAHLPGAEPPDDWTDWEGPATAKTWAESTPPQDVEIEERGARVELSWTITDPNCEGIQIFRSDADHIYGDTPYATVWPNVEFFRDEDPLTHCWYKLRSSYGASHSDWSEEVECQNYGTPNPPASFEVSKQGATWAVLTWEDNLSSAPVAKYEIALWNGSDYDLYTWVPYGFNTLKVEGLTTDTTYKFRIRAYNSKGYSTSGLEVEFTTESRETDLFDQKIGAKDMICVARIIGPSGDIIVASAEYPGAYQGAIVDSEGFQYSVSARLLPQPTPEGASGQIVISKTKGLENDDLLSVFFDPDLIGSVIEIQYYFPTSGDSVMVARGFISRIEERDGKIYIAYDDLLISKKGTIILDRSQDNPIPDIFGAAEITGTITSVEKKQVKVASHRIKDVSAVYLNDSLVDDEDYVVDYAHGIVTFGPGITLEEDDEVRAYVVGKPLETEELNNHIASVLAYYFSGYIDEENFTRILLTDTRVNIGLTEDIDAADFISRLIGPTWMRVWLAGAGLQAKNIDFNRTPALRLLNSEIKRIEKQINLQDWVSMATVRYSATLDLPAENILRRDYYQEGKEAEFTILGTLGDAHTLTDNILTDTRITQAQRANIEIPFLILSLQPCDIVELESGEKILIEKIEYIFSRQTMKIEGVLI